MFSFYFIHILFDVSGIFNSFFYPWIYFILFFISSFHGFIFIDSRIYSFIWWSFHSLLSLIFFERSIVFILIDLFSEIIRKPFENFYYLNSVTTINISFSMFKYLFYSSSLSFYRIFQSLNFSCWWELLLLSIFLVFFNSLL